MKFLFDLGGVFFDWDPKYFYKNVFKNKIDLDFFLSKVCNDNWNIKQDCGRSINEAEKELIDIFPIHEKNIKLYYANHRKMIKKTFIRSIEILIELKKSNYLCYVLSNWSSETFEGMIKDYPFLNYFDGMIISGDEKIIKPDPAIYNLAIKRFDLNPNKTVFIDDKKENIEAAKNIGFNVIHLVNPDNIKEEINKFID